LSSRWKISIWTYFNINAQPSHKNSMWQDLEKVFCDILRFSIYYVLKVLSWLRNFSKNTSKKIFFPGR
jgi:hypothetical protein